MRFLRRSVCADPKERDRDLKTFNLTPVVRRLRRTTNLLGCLRLSKNEDQADSGNAFFGVLKRS